MNLKLGFDGHWNEEILFKASVARVLISKGFFWLQSNCFVAMGKKERTGNGTIVCEVPLSDFEWIGRSCCSSPSPLLVKTFIAPQIAAMTLLLALSLGQLPFFVCLSVPGTRHGIPVADVNSASLNLKMTLQLGSGFGKGGKLLRTLPPMGLPVDDSLQMLI